MIDKLHGLGALATNQVELQECRGLSTVGHGNNAIDHGDVTLEYSKLGPQGGYLSGALRQKLRELLVQFRDFLN